MVAMPNVFGPGYNLATLTEAINIIPNLWGRLQEYNIFPAEGITTRDIAIDLVHEYLTILPEREPGSPATVGRNEDR
ncbi:MAG: major capsid protein, partial [Rhodospirillaceae bacterium]